MTHNVLVLASVSLPAVLSDRRAVGLPQAASLVESWRCLRLEAVPPRAAAFLVREMIRAGGSGAGTPGRPGGGRAVFLSGHERAFVTLLEKAARREDGRGPAREIDQALRSRERGPDAVRLRSGTLPLTRTLVMGILNLTPDSFFDGGQHATRARAVDHALRMSEEGADIIDIGGESTRPGATPVPLAEEMRRVLPVLEAIGRAFARRRGPRPLLSIDTTKAEVARRAAAAGADLINDISGLTFDPAMPMAAAQSRLPIVLSHIRGRPRTMQRAPRYAQLMVDISRFLRRGIEQAKAAGVREDRIIVDPGLGFGKRRQDNLILLRHLPVLRSLGRPILVGASRKSFLGGTLDLPASERLEGSLAAEALALAGGADIIRAHDVRQAVRVARLCDAVVRAGARVR
jgi:dihydropteroate synthase